MDSQFTLSTNELDTLTSLFEDNSYPEAYLYVSDLIRNNPHGNLNSADWFEYASSINGNKPHAINRFVRGAMKEAYGNYHDGAELTDQIFQEASDALAVSVLGGIIQTGEVPTHDILIADDVAAVVSGLGLPREAWAGTLSAWPFGFGDYFFDIPDSLGLDLMTHFSNYY